MNEVDEKYIEDYIEENSRLQNSLKESLNNQEALQAALVSATETNRFLHETIEKNNLGQIVKERKEILSKLESYEKTARDTEKRNNEARKILETIKKKESDINSYIDSEANIRIKETVTDYENRKKQLDEAFKRNKKSMDNELKDYKRKYITYMVKIILIYTVLTILSVFISIKYF